MTMLFTSKSKIGVFYKFEDTAGGKSYYNGGSASYYAKNAFRGKATRNPTMEDFNSTSFLNPSINTVKLNFEWLRNANGYNFKTNDTLIEEKKYKNIYVQFAGNTLSSNEGKLERVDSTITFFYTFVIDTINFLPCKIIRKYSLNNEDVIVTSFNNIVIDNKEIKEGSFIQSYNYLKQEPVNSISIKSDNWILPILNTNKTISKKELEGNVVFLEFFFVGCVPCKQAIPWLASLKDKYKGKSLKLYSINPVDTKALIEIYKQNNKAINYDIIYNASALVNNYAIKSYPKIILLNKKGNIIYNGDLNKQVITKLIRENL